MNAIVRNIKSSLVFLFLLFAACQSHAQFGINLGIGVSDIIFLQGGQSPYLSYDNSSVEHNYPSPSFQIGAFRMFEFSNRMVCNAGLGFSRQGLDYSYSYLYDDITYKLHISYLQLPILFKLKTNIAKNKSSGILAGPYISGRLNATMVTEIHGIKERTKKDNVNFIDTGIIVGYSWDIGKDPGKMFIDVHCAYSLINMMELLDGFPTYYGPEKEYARNIIVAVAFEIQI